MFYLEIPKRLLILRFTIKTSTMEIRFGALNPDISKQLREQNFKFENDKVKTYQVLADSIGMLWIHNCISDSEREKAYDRLYKKIQNHIKKLNKPIP